LGFTICYKSVIVTFWLKLPHATFYSIIFVPNAPSTVLVGADLGVFGGFTGLEVLIGS
jgi:hypothetical protein